MIKRKGERLDIEDAYLRPLHVGDEIKDADGKRYTIDGMGRARPLEGGSSVPFKSIREPELVTEFRPAALPKEEPAPADAPPDPEPAAEPAASAKKGHRPNKSGYVRIPNLARQLKVPHGAIREILEREGIEVTNKPTGASKNRDARIRVEDLDRAIAAIRRDYVPVTESVEEAAGATKDVKEAAAKAASGSVELDRELVRATALTGLKDPEIITRDDMIAELRRRGEYPFLGTNDPLKVFTKVEALMLLEPRDMVDRLRALGYEVTCVMSL